MTQENELGMPMEARSRRWPRRAFGSPTVWLIVGVCLVGAAASYGVVSIGGPAAFRQRFGAVAPLVTVPLHAVVALTPVPSDFVSVGNGALYGFWRGLPLTWLGWWIAALAEFWIGRRARRDFDLGERLARAPRWLQRFPVGHPVFLIGARQIPWLGGHLSTFVPGAYGVEPRRFVWCSAVAIVPSSILMTAIGAGIVPS